MTNSGYEMEGYPKEAVFERLKHSVQLLASQAEIQLRLLPEFVCKADELALEFDHWREVTLDNYGNDLTPDQASGITALDEKLSSLTNDGAQHWTDDAIRFSSDWQIVRRLAARVLEAFGWPLENPTSHTNEYISEDQFRRHREN